MYLFIYLIYLFIHSFIHLFAYLFVYLFTLKFLLVKIFLFTIFGQYSTISIYGPLSVGFI